MKRRSKQEYPSEYKNYKEVYGYGGIRIYRVSKAEAKKIVKEFRSRFPYTPPFDAPEGDQLLYMNVNHGEQHFIFSLPHSHGGDGGSSA